MRFFAWRKIGKGRLVVYETTLSDFSGEDILAEQGFLFFCDEHFKNGQQNVASLVFDMTGKKLSHDYAQEEIERIMKEAVSFHNTFNPKSYKGEYYELAEAPDDIEGEPTQLMSILVCLNLNGGRLNEEDLRKNLPKYLETNQDPFRIFRFYKSKMLEKGYIELKKG